MKIVQDYERPSENEERVRRLKPARWSIRQLLDQADYVIAEVAYNSAPEISQLGHFGWPSPVNECR
jgi:hypothetical protein